LEFSYPVSKNLINCSLGIGSLSNELPYRGRQLFEHLELETKRVAIFAKVLLLRFFK
jgi:hypothetical protein